MALDELRRAALPQLLANISATPELGPHSRRGLAIAAELLVLYGALDAALGTDRDSQFPITAANSLAHGLIAHAAAVALPAASPASYAENAAMQSTMPVASRKRQPASMSAKERQRLLRQSALIPNSLCNGGAHYVADGLDCGLRNSSVAVDVVAIGSAVVAQVVLKEQTSWHALPDSSHNTSTILGLLAPLCGPADAVLTDVSDGARRTVAVRVRAAEGSLHPVLLPVDLTSEAPSSVLPMTAAAAALAAVAPTAEAAQRSEADDALASMTQAARSACSVLMARLTRMDVEVEVAPPSVARGSAPSADGNAGATQVLHGTWTTGDQTDSAADAPTPRSQSDNANATVIVPLVPALGAQCGLTATEADRESNCNFIRLTVRRRYICNVLNDGHMLTLALPLHASSGGAVVVKSPSTASGHVAPHSLDFNLVAVDAVQLDAATHGSVMEAAPPGAPTSPNGGFRDIISPTCEGTITSTAAGASLQFTSTARDTFVGYMLAMIESAEIGARWPGLRGALEAGATAAACGGFERCSASSIALPPALRALALAALAAASVTTTSAPVEATRASCVGRDCIDSGATHVASASAPSAAIGAPVVPPPRRPPGRRRVIPAHVAIVMDGNGRWATAQSLGRSAGHRAGVAAIHRTIRACRRLGVRYLTLYAFSAQNWGRPPDEVATLMELLASFVATDAQELVANGVRLRVNGDTARLPAAARVGLHRLEVASEDNTDLQLILALSYGGREEIAGAAAAAAAAAVAGRLDPAALSTSVDAFRAYMPHPDVPDPDLLIRTSGEMRLSNFLLWQVAYAELVVMPLLWPDFGEEALLVAIDEFSSRERRFGMTSEQVLTTAASTTSTDVVMTPAHQAFARQAAPSKKRWHKRRAAAAACCGLAHTALQLRRGGTAPCGVVGLLVLMLVSFVTGFAAGPIVASSTAINSLAPHRGESMLQQHGGSWVGLKATDTDVGVGPTGDEKAQATSAHCRSESNSAEFPVLSLLRFVHAKLLGCRPCPILGDGDERNSESTVELSVGSRKTPAATGLARGSGGGSTCPCACTSSSSCRGDLASVGRVSSVSSAGGDSDPRAESEVSAATLSIASTGDDVSGAAIAMTTPTAGAHQAAPIASASSSATDGGIAVPGMLSLSPLGSAHVVSKKGVAEESSRIPQGLQLSESLR